MFDNKKTYTTPIASLGEFRLIELLTQNFSPQNKETQLAMGDDAAILSFNDEKVVVSSDMLVEQVHFNLGYVPLKHLGYKAIVVNLSDIVAMNAIPKQVLVNIAVSNRFPVEALEEIYEGIYMACKKYKIDLVGGDTTSSQTGLVISVTVIGIANENTITTRSGAKDKDLIVVTGDLGAAYMGLQVLEREWITFKNNPNLQPNLSEYTYIVERQLKPEARTDIKKTLEELDVQPTSIIDISDGLASELLHLAKQSDLGFHVYEEKLPVDSQVIATCDEFKISHTTAVLNGGEDYELLMTIPITEYEKIAKHPDFTIIGYTSEGHKESSLILSGSENHIPLTAQGWNIWGE